MTLGPANFAKSWQQLLTMQHYMRTLIVVILALYLLAYAADITWRLVPSPTLSPATSQAQVIPARAKPANRNADISRLQALNLFGDASDVEPVVQEQITEAPKTALNLTLAGVVANINPKLGVAIIENRGSQATYGIDERIEGTNAMLSEVFADRVIIKNAGRFETLMLDGIDYNQTQTGFAQSGSDRRANFVTNAARESNSKHTELSEQAVETTRSLMQHPASFTDYIAISPQRVEGELVGYAVSPGKKPSLFQEIGLQAGDVISEINGLDVTDAQQSMEAMNAMRSAQSLQITVNRAGSLLTLYLDLPSADSEP